MSDSYELAEQPGFDEDELIQRLACRVYTVSSAAKTPHAVFSFPTLSDPDRIAGSLVWAQDKTIFYSTQGTVYRGEIESGQQTSVARPILKKEQNGPTPGSSPNEYSRVIYSSLAFNADAQSLVATRSHVCRNADSSHQVEGSVKDASFSTVQCVVARKVLFALRSPFRLLCCAAHILSDLISIQKFSLTKKRIAPGPFVRCVFYLDPERCQEVFITHMSAKVERGLCYSLTFFSPFEHGPAVRSDQPYCGNR